MFASSVCKVRNVPFAKLVLQINKNPENATCFHFQSEMRGMIVTWVVFSAFRAAIVFLIAEED